MAWSKRNPSSEGTFDPNRLRTSLLNSKLNVTSPPLFQTIDSLINIAQQARSSIDEKFGKSDKLDLKNNVKETLQPANGGSFSSIYLPAGTLVTNLDGIGTDPTTYSRVGDLVTVNGMFTVNPTVGGLCEAYITLPIASYFIWDYQLAGTAVSENGEAAAIFADIVNYAAIFKWTTTVTTQYKFFFHFTYLLVAKP